MIRIALESPDQVDVYETVSSRFEVTHRLSESLDAVIPVTPYWKDYDLLEPPSALVGAFGSGEWVILAAYHREHRIGGIIIAGKNPELDLLEGRQDLAHLIDVRVDLFFRGRGIGSALIEAAVDWASGAGYSEVRVETQDVNVGACRLYQARGFQLIKVDPGTYPAAIKETQFVWARSLSPQI